MTRRPPMPSLCPICGRKPKIMGYVIRCRQFSQTREHVLKVESNTNLYPVAAWNSYVRRIQGGRLIRVEIRPAPKRKTKRAKA